VPDPSAVSAHLGPVTVLGAGSWGSALAWLLGGKGVEVRLWSRSEQQAALISETGRNPDYLPGQYFPPSVEATHELDRALADTPLVIAAIPAQALRSTLASCRANWPSDAELAIAAKGLERATGKRLSEVAREELGDVNLAVLSGPNLAEEIVRGVPTASVAASSDSALVERLQALFGSGAFRIYGNRDVAGVELGGALKNPIAIAAGVSDGLGFGNNTKATLLTRGLAEMTRLGTAAGGAAATFAGLSGLGDLIATAYSPLSRNYRAGLAMGRGSMAAEAEAALGQVAEGIPTTEAACNLAHRLAVEIPILVALQSVLTGREAPLRAVSALMTRPYRDEEPD
jgi:glycerol-3-phosphate dehydrogenase (NAD(P)+)